MPNGKKIPKSLVQTFRETVRAVDDLQRRAPETVLLYEGKPVSIRYVIEVASIFQDRMPGDIHAHLCEIAVPGEQPDDQTFAAGANCLRTLYSEIRTSRRLR